MSVFNQSRSTIIRLIFLGVFVVIIAQLVNLQLISGKYKKLAMDNALFAKVIYPDRGMIYDRKGRAVLNNTIMYDLVVTPVQVKDIDTTSLIGLLGIDTAEFNRRMIESIVKNGRFRPTVFEDLLPDDLYAKLDENIWKYPGFDLVERPVRQYPFHAAAHILGYVGEADSAAIKRSNGFYRMGDYVGKTGLEQYYEKVLMGQRGVRYIIKDNKNRLQGSYENGIYDTMAVAGKSLRTYMDIEVQQLAEKLMGNKVGAVVAIEPRTGGIIAMTSGPSFDPNLLTGAEKQINFNKLFRDVSSPLLNRAIKGQYPPGSTYKPLGALIGLDEGVITASTGVACSGAYYGCTRRLGCTEKWAGHAANLRLAIAWSCNSFFSETLRRTIDNPTFHGSKGGLVKWKEYMTAFGLGHKVGVDLPSEDGGNVPDSSVYNREYNGQWNACTMVGGGLGIGQEKMTSTPLQLANAMCIIANKGYYYVPHFVQKIDGNTPEDTLLNRYTSKHEVLTHIDDASFETVMSGMQDVVEAGTARVAKIVGINICAKTGTAENYRMIDGKRTKLKDNSMFVCFAPRENPQIAIAVVVENAGYGATWAGPIASLMMEKYLNDTLSTARLKEVERVAAADLLPSYLTREQYKQDSIRAFNYFKITNDTGAIRKFLRRERPVAPPVPKDGAVPVISNDPMIKPKTTYKMQKTATIFLS
ncbi:MAG: penicillin-binding protein 2 [Gemmatimonadaceae bacterium]|nr:penicillin-binding protein 2 [Chitinophagaceae bacterium]